MLDLDRIVEKPTSQYAEDYLGVGDLRDDGSRSYLAAFGAYILTKEVFSELAAMCRESEEGRFKEEVELTVALEHVLKSSGMLAFIPEGESYDMGNVRAYQRTFEYFGRADA